MSNYKNQISPINWVEGMALSSSHLQHTNQWVIQLTTQLRNQILGSTDFGLLGLATENNFQLYIENNQIHLSNCLAITSGGHLIVIREDQNKIQFNIPKKSIVQDEAYTLYLVVDTSSFQPIGEIDTEESPIRQPFLQPTYRLELRNEEQQNLICDSNLLPISRIEIKESMVKVDDNYIPPIHKFGSLEKTNNRINQWQIQLFEIVKNSKSYIQRCHKKNILKPTEHSILIFSKTLLKALSELMLHFQLGQTNLSPTIFVKHFIQLSKQLELSLLFMSNKEAVLHQFTKWLEIKPEKFEQIITQLSELIYTEKEHLNLAEIFNKVEALIQQLDQLYKYLPQVNNMEEQVSNDIFLNKEIKSKTERLQPSIFRT